MSSITKAPPFLELSRSTIQNFDTSDLDIEKVLSIWTGLTKCSKFISNGKRLENISWRIVNRNLVNNNQLRSQRSNNDEPELQIPSSYQTPQDRLNRGDFMSLLSIVADQGLFQRPALTKRKSSNKNLNIRSRNRSTELLTKSFSNDSLSRPKKSASSKSLKKLNTKRKSSGDVQQLQETSSIPKTNDSDIFEQPNPRLAFGVVDNNKPFPIPQQAPKLVRSDTSTSVVRGFDPNQISKSPKKPSPPLLNRSQSYQPTTTTAPIDDKKSPNSNQNARAQRVQSLFGNNNNNPHQHNHNNINNNLEQKKSKTSLFWNDSHSNNKNTDNNHLHIHNQHSERVKSPLAQDSTSYFKMDPTSTQQHVKAASTASLFQRSNQPKTTSLFDQAHNHKEQGNIPTTPSLFQQTHSTKPSSTSLFQESESSTQQHPTKTKSLFDQVGISPNVKKSISSKTKRNNVLNNLGMTSITHGSHHYQHQHPSQSHVQTSPEQIQSNNENEKKMFFIESSPSPTESINRLIDHNGRPHSPLTLVRSNSYGSYDGENDEDDVSKRDDKHAYSKNDEVRSNNLQKNTSLFSDQTKRLDFSSESSLSEESDWSSVSESDDEEYDNKIREQWENLDFKRKEQDIVKPQIKRSLLSGLFLNEMNPEHNNHYQNRHGSAHQMHQSKSTSQIHTKTHTVDNHHHTDSAPDTELSSSVRSNIAIKHRHNNSTVDTSAPLELVSAEPQSIISTSHVNVSGLVHEPSFESHTDLKSKLHEQEKQDHHQLSTSFTNLISKSALNLTNYFGHHRKNSFSSIASDRTRTRFNKHESNAPPTASTILPTALSTHMFLPNVHQRAKSKLTAVVEADSSLNNGSSQELSKLDKSDPKPSTSPKKPIAKPAITIPEIDNSVETKLETKKGSQLIPEYNISRKLSPKTTRRQMLATELSESLRKSILWDREVGLYPKGVKPPPNVKNREKRRSKRKVEGVVKQEGENEDDTNETVSSRDKDSDSSKIENNDEWGDDTDFYTRGW